MARLAQQLRRQQHGGHADWHVHHEHAAPAEELHQYAAQDQTGHKPDRGRRSIHTQSARPRRTFGETGSDQGQRGGNDERGPDTLPNARGHQQ